MRGNNRVLRSELSGVWYSHDSERLAREIDSYLKSGDDKTMDSVMALLLPHASYCYSGEVAGEAVRLVSGCSFSRVVVLGPSHRLAMTDHVSIPDVDFIETPLGRIALDRPLVDHLLEKEAFISNPAAHTQEHSVQIELPILQRALGDFKLVPMVCGKLSEAGARRVATELMECIDEDTLVVISSDFTHYGRSFGYVPFEQEVPENLRQLDHGAMEQIVAKDLSGFYAYLRHTGATICGQSPIAVLLAMLPDDARVQPLTYRTSGELTGDWSHCVSYYSAAVVGRWTLVQAVLSESDKEALLELARRTIARRLGLDYATDEPEATPAMLETMGAFVTLHKRGMLRGCIGEIFPRRALFDAVRDQAVNSAFNDPRFPSLHAGEFGEIDIEISALTPPHPVDSYNDIEVGRHGVVLYNGAHSAVFLPQVATEQGWDLDEMLGHLSMKAGLPFDAWQAGDCEFHVFEAIVFGERSR